ncbi:hypothetical protein ACC755_23465 [Rhizobium ruizarguesonis]|uniref:DUF6998 domain-containing protein n=1 Tax=Rhizobium ruizarguesonis TaxID=2081791 RepID=UPI001FE19E8E|nr:hypothetical protein [Rhizobium ruizarguesonis]
MADSSRISRINAGLCIADVFSNSLSPAQFMSRSFELPPVIAELVLARNRVRDYYKSAALTFTLDGNLIGDIGEAVAAELFGLKLSVRNGTGIDGHAPGGRSVQIKATGTGGGPAFRMVDTRADHLLFLESIWQT